MLRLDLKNTFLKNVDEKFLDFKAFHAAVLEKLKVTIIFSKTLKHFVAAALIWN